MSKREIHLPNKARDLYEAVRALPIVSPHGHCDPRWWAQNDPFSDPAELLIVPDHYVFRMLYSQGVPLDKLGVGVPQEQRDARTIFRVFADHWHCFLGTPSRGWVEHTFYETLDVDCDLSPETADRVFDQISEKLRDPSFLPRSLFESFNIEVLATTDWATDALDHHSVILSSGWSGRVIPTFRPDAVLNPIRRDYAASMALLAEQTNSDLTDFDTYLDALRQRRAFFKIKGATATDHDVPNLMTQWLPRSEIEHLHQNARSGTISAVDAERYYGHMLIEMAQMSAEDGLVMQLHVGSTRNTNRELFESLGPDKGADIPKAVDFVGGLDGLLNRVGNNPNLQVLVFTLDETTYARELAPMAGHWPCLKIGPPWWFHDSLNGMRRYFDQVVESAGYFILTGFNDDTRAFLSIPARHDTWRRAVALHLADQIERGVLGQQDAQMLAQQLCYDLAVKAYRLS